MHKPNPAVEDLLTTTRSVRRRLDLDRAVDAEVVRDCLRVATQAPSGGNHQIWRWIIVIDPHVRYTLGEIYKRTNSPFVESLEQRVVAGEHSFRSEASSARVMTDNLGRVPVIVAACFERLPWMDRNAYGNASAYGSVFPAVWNFQLACRSRGLATCTLTSQLQDEDAIASILRLPSSFEQACLVAVAYPNSPDFTTARRGPLDAVVRTDFWSA